MAFSIEKSEDYAMSNNTNFFNLPISGVYIKNPYHLRLSSSLRSGSPLPDELRLPIEASFAVNLSDVVIYRGPGANWENLNRGSLAFASDRYIVLSDAICHWDVASLNAVLAHELCHIVQKRLARSGVYPLRSARDYEREADLWAIAWQRGVVPPRPTPDPSSILRSFDYQGHYYTVYFVALVAGVPHERAKELAYFAQFPDEIIELDALKVVLDWARSEITDNPTVAAEFLNKTQYASLQLYAANVIYTRSGWRDEAIRKYQRKLYLRYGEVVGKAMMTIKTYCLTIQAGLHCLNGGKSQSETKFRFDNLVRMNPEKDAMLFGIGLHALADSFAHRQIRLETKMYPPLVGHGRDAAFGFKMSGLDVEYYGGHAADNISVRQTLYKAYGNALFRLFRYKYRNRRSLIPSDENITDYRNTELSILLSIAASSPDEEEQVRWLRRMIEAALGRPTHVPNGDQRLRALERLAEAAIKESISDIPSNYKPRGMAIPFEEYHKSDMAKIYPVWTADLGNIFNRAKAWSHERRG